MKKLLLFLFLLPLIAMAQKPFKIPSDTLEIGYTVAGGKMKIYTDKSGADSGRVYFNDTKNRRIVFLDTVYDGNYKVINMNDSVSTFVSKAYFWANMAGGGADTIYINQTAIGGGTAMYVNNDTVYVVSDTSKVSKNGGDTIRGNLNLNIPGFYMIINPEEGFKKYNGSYETNYTDGRVSYANGANDIILNFSNPTGNNIIYLPDSSGTIALMQNVNAKADTSITITGGIGITGGGSLSANRTVEVDTSVIVTKANLSAHSYLTGTDTTGKYYSQLATDNRLNTKVNIEDTISNASGQYATQYDNSLKLNKTDTSNLVGDTYLANNYYNKAHEDTANLGLKTRTNTWTKTNTFSYPTYIDSSIFHRKFGSNTISGKTYFDRARGTITSPSTLVTGDSIGSLLFRGYDGSNYSVGASIDVFSRGTIAANKIPTYIRFLTKYDAGAGSYGFVTGNDAGGNALFWHSAATGGILTTNYGLMLGPSVTSLNAPTTIAIRIANTDNLTISSSLFQFENAKKIDIKRSPSGAGHNLTIAGAGAVSGGNNIVGGNLILQSGFGTGSQGYAYTSIQNTNMQVVGTAALTDNNTYTDRFFLPSTKHLNENVEDTLFEVTLGTDSMMTCIVDYGITFRDANIDSSWCRAGQYKITAVKVTATTLRTTTFTDLYQEDITIGTVTMTPLLRLGSNKVVVTVKYHTSFRTTTNQTKGEMKIDFTGTSLRGNITNLKFY